MDQITTTELQILRMLLSRALSTAASGIFTLPEQKSINEACHAVESALHYL